MPGALFFLVGNYQLRDPYQAQNIFVIIDLDVKFEVDSDSAIKYNLTPCFR